MKKTLKELLSLEKLEILVKNIQTNNPGGEFLCRDLSPCTANVENSVILIVFVKGLGNSDNYASIARVSRKYRARNLLWDPSPPGDYIIKTTSKD